MSQYKFLLQPEYAGYWELSSPPNSFRIAITQKPNWLHRKMVKLMFGWTWIEGK